MKKSPEILKVISVADQVTSTVLEKYSIAAGSIDASKIYIIKRDAWPSDDGAQFILNHQCVLMPEGENHMKQVYRLAHELLHFKSYQAGQILPDERNGDIPKEIYLKQKDTLMRASLALEEKQKISTAEEMIGSNPCGSGFWI